MHARMHASTSCHSRRLPPNRHVFAQRQSLSPDAIFKTKRPTNLAPAPASAFVCPVSIASCTTSFSLFTPLQFAPLHHDCHQHPPCQTRARSRQLASAPVDSIIRRLTLQPAPCPAALLAPMPAISSLAGARRRPLLHHLLVDPQHRSITLHDVSRRTRLRSVPAAGFAGNVEDEVLEAIDYGATVAGCRRSWPCQFVC